MLNKKLKGKKSVCFFTKLRLYDVPFITHVCARCVHTCNHVYIHIYIPPAIYTYIYYYVHTYYISYNIILLFHIHVYIIYIYIYILLYLKEGTVHYYHVWYMVI